MFQPNYWRAVARHMRMGYTRVQAALAGTRQIFVAILGCTATLIFAFLPLLALPGTAGKFIRVLPMAVVTTILGSLLLALFIIPFIASRVLDEKSQGHENQFLKRVMSVIHNYYRPALHWCLARPKFTVAAALGGSLLLSAARSVLFNRVLDARVADGSWERGMDGEVWMLAGSRSVFGPEPWSDALAGRLAGFDIHPSGPLWGRGDLRSEGPCRELELAALADAESLALRDGLERAGLEQERRALRVRADGLAWEWADPASLRLAFSLPPGSYATAVLAQLGDIADAAP